MRATVIIQLFSVMKNCVAFLDRKIQMVNVPKGDKSEFVVVLIIREGGNQWASRSHIKYLRADLQEIAIMKL